MKILTKLLTTAVVALAGLSHAWANTATKDERPNFLFIITDDQSWEHTSFAGLEAIKTPNFDSIANNGIYFSHAFSAAPSCTASRGAIITGQPMWQLGKGSQLWGEFDTKTQNSYQLLLREHGYRIGVIGKGWGPGLLINENPLGPAFNHLQSNYDPAFTRQDMVRNFENMLAKTDANKPFSFWISPTEPHRPFLLDIGKNSGMVALDKIRIPGFLPDETDIREDLADYLYEIAWFDKELGEIINVLKEKGLYDNTVIIYTSDNGMPFPRSKSSLYHHGTRVPLAIQWPAVTKASQVSNKMISLIDLAPTFLELAGIKPPAEMRGKSLANILQNKHDSADRTFAMSGQERHIYNARFGNNGYPARAIYTEKYVYIRNLQIKRWPSGLPKRYADIDDGSRSKSKVINGDYKNADYYSKLIFEKRPAEELYDITADRDQLVNLAEDPKHAIELAKLRKLMDSQLAATNDPRTTGDGKEFELVPYHSPDLNQETFAE